MAEHIGQTKDTTRETEDGFNNMGKPIPMHRREAAYRHAKQMGCNSDEAVAVVSGMSEQLERDKPYEAQAAGMKYLDLTGTYRLMSVLLIEPKPVVRVPAGRA